MLARALRRGPQSLLAESQRVSRWLSSAPAEAVRMPIDARPQLAVVASGKHKQGVLEALTSAIADYGGSIASAERVETGGVFSAILEVWVPPGKGGPVNPAKLHEKLVWKVPVARGDDETTVMVHNVEHKSEILVEAREEWMLRIEGWQEPGTLNGLSRVLLDGESVVKRLAARTAPAGRGSGEGLIFSAEGLVLVRPGTGKSIKAKLNEWISDNDNLTALHFEQAT